MWKRAIQKLERALDHARQQTTTERWFCGWWCRAHGRVVGRMAHMPAIYFIGISITIYSYIYMYIYLYNIYSICPMSMHVLQKHTHNWAHIALWMHCRLQCIMSCYSHFAIGNCQCMESMLSAEHWMSSHQILLLLPSLLSMWLYARLLHPMGDKHEQKYTWVRETRRKKIRSNG